MTSEPHSDSSGSSPGQPERRAELIRIFDKLDDQAKQELLRLAKQLAQSRNWQTEFHDPVDHAGDVPPVR
jgi:hypothetical protein